MSDDAAATAAKEAILVVLDSYVEGYWPSSDELATAAVEAARPLIEAQTRAKVGAEIQAFARQLYGPTSSRSDAPNGGLDLLIELNGRIIYSADSRESS